MPEKEGYIGIIQLLGEAIGLMEAGEARSLVEKARAETIKIARQSLTSLEIGIDLDQTFRDIEKLNG